MSIDEALKQLSFVERKGSAVIKEVSAYTFKRLRMTVCLVLAVLFVSGDR